MPIMLSADPTCKIKDSQRRFEKKFYGELEAEMEAIQQQMADAKKIERSKALKEAKCFCKDFGFTAGTLKGSLAEGRETL